MQIQEKLFLLRDKMNLEGLDACIIPSADPHLSEYPAEHWKIRQWLSDFTGSAGTLVVTHNEAGLWTDSRYFLQAEQELNPDYIKIFKEAMPGVPDYIEWLNEILNPFSKVGFNGSLISVSQFRKMAKIFKNKKIKAVPNFIAAEEIWDARPPLPDNTVFEHEDPWNGRSRSDKLEEIRKIMNEKKVTHYIASSLDEVAWALNLRGNDVPYNPVFYSYLMIEPHCARFFINPHKLTAGIAKKLDADHVKVSLYENFLQHIKDISGDANVFFDPDKTNSLIYSTLSPKSYKYEDLSIITKLKAEKNKNEIQNLRTVLVNDGVAMVHFLKWLEDNVESGKISEISAAKKLKEFRKKQEGFIGESFASISAYNEHAAIIHYTANKATNSFLKPEGVYLIDSGGQYKGGTSDITRTIALGKFPKQAAIDYTLVLKGHIALACATFPKGTRGVHLDTLARTALWEHGLNYGHGTGHGIGYFLNVHEGPQNIRPQDNGIEFEAGMVTSNEPGMYREGKYGIRIENLILCKKKKNTEFGTFMNFETITLCPLDTKLIVTSLMTESEIEWLNNYHQLVVDSLSPFLDSKHKEWLNNQCKRIN